MFKLRCTGSILAGSLVVLSFAPAVLAALPASLTQPQQVISYPEFSAWDDDCDPINDYSSCRGS